MGKSQRLRMKDVKGMLELMGDVQQLVGDPMAWRQRFIDGVTELFRGKQGVLCYFKGHSPDGELDLVPDKLVQSGQADEADRRIWTWWAAEGNPRLDPCADRSSRSGRTVAAYTRSTLVPNEEWYNSNFFNIVPRHTYTDGAVIGFYKLDAPGDWVQGWVVHGYLGDGTYGNRDRKLSYLLTRQLHRLYQQGVIDPGEDPRMKGLTDRQRQILEQLLAGLSDRDIADRLGLSWHTVRDYAKRLYKHFNVRGRSELIAHFHGS